MHSATVKNNKPNPGRGCTTAPNKKEGWACGEARRRSEDPWEATPTTAGPPHLQTYSPLGLGFAARKPTGAEGRDGVRNQKRRSRQSRDGD